MPENDQQDVCSGAPPAQPGQAVFVYDAARGQWITCSEQCGGALCLVPPFSGQHGEVNVVACESLENIDLSLYHLVLRNQPADGDEEKG